MNVGVTYLRQFQIMKGGGLAAKAYNSHVRVLTPGGLPVLTQRLGICGVKPMLARGHER